MLSFTANFDLLRPLLKWVELNIGVDWDWDDHQDGTYTVTYFEYTAKEGDKIVAKAKELGIDRD